MWPVVSGETTMRAVTQMESVISLAVAWAA